MKVSFESLEKRKLLTSEPLHLATNIPVDVPYHIAATGTSVPYFIVPIQNSVSTHLTHTGTLMITGTMGNDTIEVLPSETTSTSKSGKHTIQPSISIENIAGATFNRADVKRIVVDAGAGDDHVVISPNLTMRTTLIGGKGDDTLVGGGGADVIRGGAGNDQLFTGSSVIVHADGTSDLFGSLVLPDSALVIYSGAFPPNDLFPTATQSTVYEGGKTADSLEGGAGNDTLNAGNGPDSLNGGDGKDTVITIGRGTAVPNPIFFRRGDDARSFDGLTMFSVEAITPM